MKINNITSTNFGAGVRILYSENKNYWNLNGDIENIRKEFKIPVSFHTPEIELPSASKTILKRLKDLGIKFSSK